MSRFGLAWVAVATLVPLVLGVGPLRAGDAQPVHTGTRMLRSGSLIVEIGDPESALCQWNKGLRFSPVANVLRAQLGDRAFLYAPVSGGALTYLGGLPMEFDIGQEAFQPDPPGYNEGKSGDPFLKIGVGILRRDSGAYNFSSNYPVVELAHTAVTWQEDRAHFVQTLAGSANGYSCRLEEDIIVKNDRIIMEYLLRNTGTKQFTTEQYLHNFLCFSGRPVGPSVRLSFPYDFTTSPAVAPWQPPTRGRVFAAAAPAVVRIANMIEYMETASSVPKIWVYKPQDYAGPDRIATEHLETRQRVTIESSIPAAYVGIWTTNYQVSPEQFVQITLAPGAEERFTRTYTFRVDGFVPQDSTGDGTVDANDLSLLSSAWLRKPENVHWAPACDISSPADDRIDLGDLAALSRQWRQEGGLPAPVAHWKLDETAGITALDERGRLHAVLHNFPADDSPWVPGTVGGGLRFDGTEDYAQIDAPLEITGKGPRTITAWIKVSEKPAANQAILAWGEPANGQHWLLEVDASRRLRFSCGAGYAFASRLIGDTQWHHVAVALDPLVPGSPQVSDIRLYVDAGPQVVYEMAERPLDAAGTETLRIGAPYDPNESAHFNGILDDVRIYDTALSPANIRRIYTGGSAE
jgi:hypothetical protein